MKFNINDMVKVKLTKAGVNELRRAHEDLNERCCCDFPFTEPLVDEDGYSKFQLWCLMSNLGHKCGMGHELPFETNIIIEENK